MYKSATLPCNPAAAGAAEARQQQQQQHGPGVCQSVELHCTTFVLSSESAATINTDATTTTKAHQGTR
jgi:hypothetical protein